MGNSMSSALLRTIMPNCLVFRSVYRSLCQDSLNILCYPDSFLMKKKGGEGEARKRFLVVK